MNIDSKLKRFVILLGRAPFILFIESAAPISVNPLLRSIGLSDVAAIVPQEVHEQTTLITVFDLIYKKLPDPITYEAVETLVAALPLPSYPYFGIVEFGSTEWQEHIEWQNVDNKPVPSNDFTIGIAKFTHEIRIFSGREPNTAGHDGVINLHSLDAGVPFPLALLKECVINIHDIIVQASIGRTITAMAESKYLSVMQTGHDSFSYINMKKAEKDLRAILKAFGIDVEKPIEG